MRVAAEALDDLIVSPGVVKEVAKLFALFGGNLGDQGCISSHTEILVLHVFTVFQWKVEEDPLDRLERGILALLDAF